MGKKPVQSFVFCGSTSFSYALIFSVRLRSFNIPKDPQAPYALQCNPKRFIVWNFDRRK